MFLPLQSAVQIVSLSSSNPITPIGILDSSLSRLPVAFFLLDPCYALCLPLTFTKQNVSRKSLNRLISCTERWWTKKEHSKKRNQSSSTSMIPKNQMGTQKIASILETRPRSCFGKSWNHEILGTDLNPQRTSHLSENPFQLRIRPLHRS